MKRPLRDAMMTAPRNCPAWDGGRRGLLGFGQAPSPVFLIMLLAGCFVVASARATPDFTWKQDTGTVALVGKGGHVVWQFNYALAQAKPYFHPVALPDSPSLSWLAPPDHAWHYGLWFTWKYLNGKIYWEFDRKGSVLNGG